MKLGIIVREMLSSDAMSSTCELEFDAQCVYEERV